MRYGSVCSGIEAATVAWHPLGWKASFFSEIEAFPRAVLAHHYPSVPLHGDFTTIGEHDYEPIDLLVGGTPCQSFSVAGLRKGLDDDRGNLALEFIVLAQRLRPRWVVWENVPGVLSSGRGRDFGSFLGALGEIGYGFAYRVLDAQYFGVAQRRRRVFVVGHLGDWRRAAAVLFERESLSGNPAPIREAREVAPIIPARSTGGGGIKADFNCDGGLRLALPVREVAGCLNSAGGNAVPGNSLQDVDQGYLLPVPSHDPACTLTARDHKGSLPEADLSTVISFHPTQEPIHSTNVCHALGANANANATAAIAFSCKDHGAGAAEGLTPTMRAMSHDGSHQNGGGQLAVAFEPGSIARNAGPCGESHLSPTLRAEMGDNQPAVRQGMSVRRLTPVECERLQGFPDDYTAIPYRNKPADKCPDGPRYKALGNSMAVPVVRWLGQRIEMVEATA